MLQIYIESIMKKYEKITSQLRSAIYGSCTDFPFEYKLNIKINFSGVLDVIEILCCFTI